jgi:hypothetical protein
LLLLELPSWAVFSKALRAAGATPWDRNVLLVEKIGAAECCGSGIPVDNPPRRTSLDGDRAQGLQSKTPSTFAEAMAKKSKGKARGVGEPAVRTPLEPLAPTTESRASLLDSATLDEILSLQLLVAWAGEGKTDPPRLGWWRTSLIDEFGGEDLFARLMPRTWKWAVLEGARIAARIVDAETRSHAADGDQLISLFHFGFAIDEQLDDRLAELKRTASEPVEALPTLAAIRSPWNIDAFRASLRDLAAVTITASSIGRRLKGTMPEGPVDAARMLAAAMAQPSDRYPAPHWKVE